MSEFPKVIWIGKLNHQVYRVVDRGPAREVQSIDARDETRAQTAQRIAERYQRFVVEQARGRDAMGEKSWAAVPEHGRVDALRVLTKALGQFLTISPFDPIKPNLQLHLTHPLYCELNTAVAEDRPARGCDCERQVAPGAAFDSDQMTKPEVVVTTLPAIGKTISRALGTWYS